jgi:acyl-CoA synthetase (AMP-forming)/AMP-acid ligase II
VRCTAHETAQLLSHSRARAVLCDLARTALAREAAAAVGVPLYGCAPDLPLRPRLVRRNGSGRTRSAAPVHPEMLAVLAYTSGTTGAPKGVMITHGNLLWAALACATARGDRPDGIGACISPLSHTPVFVSHLLCRVLLGASAVLLEKFDAEAMLEAVARYGITDLPLIAGMVFSVVELGAIPAATRATVEKVSVGGAATPMDAKHALARIFEGAEIIEAYGQSESTDGVAMARGSSVFDHPGTMGRMNPYVQLAVHRADGVPAEVGEEGELVVRGPTVMRGYYRDRRATAQALRGGWLHTGDLGRRNHAGYFFVTGRVKDLIITGGENVSPVEVEDVLRLHPDVADVAVIGTPHPRWGEQVTAVVVLKTGAHLERDALNAFAGTRLAAFKKPRRIEFVASLPRNAANKVQTSVLKQQFS